MGTKVREKKKSFNFMLKPSVKIKGEKIAAKKNLTLSQLIEILIYDYNVE